MRDEQKSISDIRKVLKIWGKLSEIWAKDIFNNKMSD